MTCTQWVLPDRENDSGAREPSGDHRSGTWSRVFEVMIIV